MDELWQTIMETCPILMTEWLSCFQGDEQAAKSEISETLTNRDKWKDRSGNFLLRLVSDDRNGYRDVSGNYKPRVQLALAFIRHMSKNDFFTEFVETMLTVHGGEETVEDVGDQVNHAAAESPKDHVDFGIGLVNLGVNEERRGNGVLHEAAKSGRCCDLEHFLSDTNVDAPNNIGETALHLAAEFEHGRDVALLLRAGATIKVSSHFLVVTRLLLYRVTQIKLYPEIC